MIESMTGFGSGRAAASSKAPAAPRLAGSAVEVHLHSVNNRTFKLSVRTPESLTRLAPELEGLIKSKIARGTVYCQVELDGPAVLTYALDEESLLGYCRQLRTLAKKAGLSQQTRIELIAALPGAMRESAEVQTGIGALVLAAARKALNALLASRRAEGEKIKKEFRKLLSAIVSLRDRVVRSRKDFLHKHRRKLAGRVRELLADSGVKADKNALVRETALLAERSDIAEELQRLSIHTSLIEKALSSRKPVGRRLEFIAQEMLREANTMSAKSVSSKLVVPLLELKANIDKIREQAQNVQ